MFKYEEFADNNFFLKRNATIIQRQDCCHVVVGFTTTYAISTFHRLSHEFDFLLCQRVPDTTNSK